MLLLLLNIIKLLLLFVISQLYHLWWIKIFKISYENKMSI